jgi:hypothetical protein
MSGANQSVNIIGITVFYIEQYGYCLLNIIRADLDSRPESLTKVCN